MVAPLASGNSMFQSSRAGMSRSGPDGRTIQTIVELFESNK